MKNIAPIAWVSVFVCPSFVDSTKFDHKTRLQSEGDLLSIERFGGFYFLIQNNMNIFNWWYFVSKFCFVENKTMLEI